MEKYHPRLLTNYTNSRLNLNKCSIRADELSSADTVLMLMTSVSAIYETLYPMQSLVLGIHLKSLDLDWNIKDAAFY